MNLLDICLLAVALAMDCFAVSIVSGIILRSRSCLPVRPAFRMAGLFGLFQGLMPLAGWFGITRFSYRFEDYDHWVAFALLLFVGVNMIREALVAEEEHHFNPAHLHTQLLLAVATSIDALAIGISFACTGYRVLSRLVLPLVIIGVVSLAFSLLGCSLGFHFGRSIARRLKPGLLGGTILILIGIKILLVHVLG